MQRRNAPIKHGRKLVLYSYAPQYQAPVFGNDEEIGNGICQSPVLKSTLSAQSGAPGIYIKIIQSRCHRSILLCSYRFGTNRICCKSLQCDVVEQAWKGRDIEVEKKVEIDNLKRNSCLL